MAADIIHEPADRSTASGICQAFGLHPLAAVGMIAVDWMLFGEEAVTLGAGWVISVGVASVLSVACLLVQRYLYKDSWGAAAAKALMVGVLTAIPTAIPSFLLVPSGVLGAIKNVLPGRAQRQLQS